jgi:GNAT superfamily N-acetyltransferase
MARSAVQVTRVTPGEAEALAALWRQSKVAEGHTGDHAERALRDGRLVRCCDRPDVRVYLASIDSEPVGYTVVMAGPVTALQENVAVWVDLLWVTPGRRGRGVSGALLSAVATYAEQIGATEVVSRVPSSNRDANRFFARLGFASVVTERTTTPAALRRRLAGPGLVGVHDAVRKRRSLRALARGREASLTAAK